MVWDKGSSGLVFYTDASYWDQQDGGEGPHRVASARTHARTRAHARSFDSVTVYDYVMLL